MEYQPFNSLLEYDSNASNQLLEKVVLLKIELNGEEDNICKINKTKCLIKFRHLSCFNYCMRKQNAILSIGCFTCYLVIGKQR